MFDENDIELDVREELGDVVITARYGALFMRWIMLGIEASVELGMDIRRKMTAEIRHHVNPPGVIQAGSPAYREYHTIRPYHPITFTGHYQPTQLGIGTPTIQPVTPVNGNWSIQRSSETLGDDPLQYMELKPKITPEMEAYNEYDQSDD